MTYEEIPYRQCKAEEFQSNDEVFELEHFESMFIDKSQADKFFNSLFCIDHPLQLLSKTVVGDNERSLRIMFESCHESWYTGSDACKPLREINEYIKDKGLLTLTNTEKFNQNFEENVVT